MQPFEECLAGSQNRRMVRIREGCTSIVAITSERGSGGGEDVGELERG